MLPQVQQQLKTGKLLPEIHTTSGEDVEMPAISDLPMVQGPKSSSLSVPLPVDSSLFLQTNHLTPFKPSIPDTPTRLGGSMNNLHFELGNYGSPSVLQERLFTNAGRGLKPQVSLNKNFKFDGISTPGIHRVSLVNATPLKEISRTSLKVLPNGPLHYDQFDEVSPEVDRSGFTNQLRNPSPLYSRRVTANPVAISGSNGGLPNDRDGRSWNATSGDDPMDIGWR